MASECDGRLVVPCYRLINNELLSRAVGRSDGRTRKTVWQVQPQRRPAVVTTDPDRTDASNHMAENRHDRQTDRPH